MQSLIAITVELDKLKSVYRKSYITDSTRFENSAEHSWHLAMTLMGFSQYLPKNIDINKAMKMALCHDLCEIGAGDHCAYKTDDNVHQKELEYMNQFQSMFVGFGNEAKSLWSEYESQETLESKWVKVFDKLLPFVLNIETKGKTWNEQNITYSQIIKHNGFIKLMAPDMYTWMLEQIEIGVKEQWILPD